MCITARDGVLFTSGPLRVSGFDPKQRFRLAAIAPRFIDAPQTEQQQKRRRSRNVDLGFAAVCFAGFLEVFGLGTNQTPSTISAANHFAVSIPLLVGSALLASLVTRYGEQRRHLWRHWAVLALDFVGMVGTIGGVLGIHQMFKAVSPIAGTNFIYTCLGLLALGVVWQKAELILLRLLGKRDA